MQREHEKGEETELPGRRHVKFAILNDAGSYLNKHHAALSKAAQTNTVGIISFLDTSSLLSLFFPGIYASD